MTSVVIETFNLGREKRAGLETLFDALASQVADVEVAVTHVDLDPQTRASLAARLGRPITWVALPATAGYYDHKNAGFAATTGAHVAFIDGDCPPSSTWLAALLAPLRDGSARVVAGATSYAGTLAPIANRLDFPYFDRYFPRQFGAGEGNACHVRNFFANNVAFARDVFEELHGYPTISPMFHGQCQVLALRLAERGIAIQFAREARVTHAWPQSVREWFAVRLLRGADARMLLPYIAGSIAPPTAPVIARLGALPTLAMLGVRAVLVAGRALRGGPRQVALVAGCTVVDAVGAAAAPLVYRRLAA